MRAEKHKISLVVPTDYKEFLGNFRAGKLSRLRTTELQTTLDIPLRTYQLVRNTPINELSRSFIWSASVVKTDGFPNGTNLEIPKHY